MVRMFSSGTEYDLAVIGGGPGGYVGAIKAAQLGLKVRHKNLCALRLDSEHLR
jgi:pyruvate/2-oxoglutarate dehydrogenase complex dihydrolipoamide dehydrogenase (E3) component